MILGNDPGNSAVYICQNGFNIVGEAIRTCLADGTWSGEAPTCGSKFWIAMHVYANELVTRNSILVVLEL